MDIYEQIVELYLTAVEGCAVIPQVPILKSIEGKPWVAYPDFLGIDFDKQCIWIVEVSKSTTRETAINLAAKLQPEHRSNIEHYVKSSTLNNELNFPIYWRFIVRRSNIEVLKSSPAYREYTEKGGQVEPIALEDVFDRIRDLMP
jgi:hypothetical protein